MKPLTLDELKENCRIVSAAIGIEPDVEKRAMYLTTETGEVVKEVLRYLYASTEEKKGAAVAALGLELFDVLWNVCDLARLLDIDLEAACREKMEHNRNRDWNYYR